MAVDTPIEYTTLAAMHDEFGQYLNDSIYQTSKPLDTVMTSPLVERMMNASGEYCRWSIRRNRGRTQGNNMANQYKFEVLDLYNQAAVACLNKGATRDWSLPEDLIVAAEGKNRILDFVRDGQNDAEETLRNTLNKGMLNGSTSVANGWDGFNENMIGIADGTYAGISHGAAGVDQSGAALYYWRPKRVSTTDAATWATQCLSKIHEVVMWLRAIHSNPTEAYTTQEMYSALYNKIEDRHRLIEEVAGNNGKAVGIGWQAIKVHGLNVYYDIDVPAGRFFIINPKTLRLWCYDAQLFVTKTDQDLSRNSRLFLVVSRSNLIMLDPRANGVIYYSG